jgi:hypothetical protein
VKVDMALAVQTLALLGAMAMQYASLTSQIEVLKVKVSYVEQRLKLTGI